LKLCDSGEAPGVAEGRGRGLNGRNPLQKGSVTVKKLGFETRGRGAIAAMLLAGSLLMGGSPALAQDAALSALTGSISSDGSSTVGPLTQAVAEEFIGAAPGVEISVDISGTGGGFERFCTGETDVQNASRAIKDEEAANCAANGVDWYEFEVAYDGVTIVTNKENTWATCLTVDQLKQLWQKESPAMTWADLNPEWPAEMVNLYGPGTDSGTFDFFVETILGEDDIREDFNPSEDDNVLVSGVGGDVNALGYFGLAYYEANTDTLNAVAIDNNDGNCVAPSPESVRDGTYAPLSRPLYVYVSAAALDRPEVQEFTRFYLANAATLAPEVGYVASPEETYAADMEAFEADIAGTGTPHSQQVAATPAA
jgi:phosphate transport system substrate-binding protein